MIGIQVFAFPELSVLLALLYVALWAEGKIAERSLLTQSDGNVLGFVEEFQGRPKAHKF